MQVPGRYLVAWGLGALLLLGGMGVLGLRSSSREPIQILLPTPTAQAPELKVYVSGAVQLPGVYLLARSDRIEDALRAAGGITPEADLERLNLAAKLRDGDHLLVPKKGEQVPAGKAGAPRVNLNTATAAMLDALPGIGPTRAQRIVESRAKDGPFLDPRELVDRKILPASIYEQLKELIAVN